MCEFVITKLRTFTFQVAFLIDEAFNVGNGANAIISMLHYFPKHVGYGNLTVHLLADNCAGSHPKHESTSFRMNVEHFPCHCW